MCGVNVFYFVCDICCVALLCRYIMFGTNCYDAAYTDGQTRGSYRMSFRATSDGVRCRYHSKHCAVPKMACVI